jgi:hypothetical protein
VFVILTALHALRSSANEAGAEVAADAFHIDRRAK